MEGDRTLGNGTGGNVSDVAISVPELPKKHLQILSSGDEEEKEGGNASDDPIRVLHPEMEPLRRERSDLQRTLASSSADFQQALILKSLEAENARAEADTTKKTLEDQKNDLEDCVRHIEGRMADLMMEKESEAANFLKEAELRLFAEKLNFEAEKARVAPNEKEVAVAFILKEQNKWPKEKEANIKIAEEKESLTSIEDRRRMLRETYDKQRAVDRERVRLVMEISEQAVEDNTKLYATLKEKEKLAVEKKKMYENWKDEKLKRLRDRKSNYEEWIQGILSGDMDVQEEVIASFMEELGIQPEKWRNAFDIEKKKVVAAMKKGQDLLASCKKVRMVRMEMEAAANKKHDETMKKILDLQSDYEEQMERILSWEKDDDIRQYCRQMKPWKVEDELKFLLVTAAIVVASIVAAAALRFGHATLGE